MLPWARRVISITEVRILPMRFLDPPFEQVGRHVEGLSLGAMIELTVKSVFKFIVLFFIHQYLLLICLF